MRLQSAFILVLALLLCLAPLSLAQDVQTTSHYGIDVGDSDATVNWFLNYSTNLKNLRLTLSFFIPPNATLISVSDGLGEISSPTVMETPNGEEVTVTARNGPDGGPIALAIRYSVKHIIVHSYGRLRITTPLCLAVTNSSSADVTLPDGAVLLASSPAAKTGLQTASFLSVAECIKLSYMLASGEGQGGYSHYATQHYEVFGRNIDAKLKGEIADLELQYSLFPTMTGLQPDYSKWVVVIVPKADLSSKGEAGSYNGGGLIYLLEEQQLESGETGLAPILAHETVHGFNGGPFAWNHGSSFWFEEGTAEYGAHIASQLMGLRQGDFFVKGSPYYTSTYSDLADYYGSGSTRMETWDFSSLDQFSYDYSQFLIRAYVDAYGTDALRQSYDCLRRVPPDREVSGPAEVNSLVLDCMSKAAGGGGVAAPDSILYPGRALFNSNERAFEHYAASIGAASWKGESKPLPKSAYDLPPLPYEAESQSALDSLSASYRTLQPFTSDDARAQYQSSFALYNDAQALHQQGSYRDSLAKAQLAHLYLNNALAAEVAYKAAQAAGQHDAQPGTYGNGTSTNQGGNGSSSRQVFPCLPAYALVGLLALAAYAGKRQ
jgi:hypothetical protein